MRRLQTVFFLLITFVANAQFSSEVWHEGFLVTSDDDTLRGQIKYNMETNIVQFHDGQNFRTFSSFSITYVEIFDKILESYRKFYTLPYRIKFDYKTDILFELLFEGPLSLMSREEIIQETVNTGVSVFGPTGFRNRLDYSFYFVDTKGNLRTYSGKKTDLFNIMSDKSADVRSFIRQNRLKVDEVKDLVRITAFYNSI